MTDKAELHLPLADKRNFEALAAKSQLESETRATDAALAEHPSKPTLPASPSAEP